MIGYRPGHGVLHRAHPFTVGAIGIAVAILAFALPAPAGPLGLAAGAVLLVLAARAAHLLLPALAMSIPFWLLLAVLHVVLGDDPVLAVTVGARIAAILLVLLLVLAVVEPARLVDALAAGRVPFAVAYLLSSTLQAVPRLRDRARTILEAQRCRGLRVRGSLGRRVAAIAPLAIPLVLGALAEVDERAFALEARGAAVVERRTPLRLPPDSAGQRVLRWLLVVGAVVVAVARVVW